MAWRVGIDTGGTFTDTVGVNEATGERRVYKIPSTPEDPSRAFRDGIRGLMTEIGAQPSDIQLTVHGSTVATNAILESKYSKVGLLVNSGYGEMLECARQTVPGDFGDIMWWIKPPRVVPLELVREISGRLNYKGEQLESLDEDEIRYLAREFKSLGIDALAVSLLHSYRSPVHEERVRELIKEVHPHCYVSISADVIREYREYERTLSTCLNTGLMPLCSSYIGALQARLSAEELTSPLYMMKSSGGIAIAEELVPNPISAVLSGPAAGVITAAHYAQATGYQNIITTDIGGTSTDICLIDHGAPHMLTEGQIDIFNIKTPMVDMHTVGAGGGSIAWLAAGRSLRVGPQSAGATPGPVCYDQAGEDPTLTDAHLVLGRISPYLLGGSISLDVGLARDAIAQRIGKPLGLSVEQAATGILDLATTNMAQGINVVSVKRGRDPRDYVLMAFGGAGGLNACRVSDALGIRTAIFPPAPGVTSAEGLLSTDVRVDHVITHVQREGAFDLERLNADYEKVCANVLDDLQRQGFAGEQVQVEAFADMRYTGQAYELRVPLEPDTGGITEAAISQAMKRFHQMHDDRYGYQYEGEESVEAVNIGATGLGLFSRPALPKPRGEGRARPAAEKGTRRTYTSAGYLDCPVYERFLLPTGERIPGPAVIEQYDSTLFIEPGWVAQVDSADQVILAR